MSLLSTAVKIGRRIDLCTLLKQWPINKSVSIHCNNKCQRDLSTAVKHWTGIPKWPKHRFSKRNRFSANARHDLGHIGYPVDVADLLFTPERDFLVKNNGQKIKVDDLRGKTLLLFIFPLDVGYKDVASDAWDMIDAYYELLRVGSDVEFVFVPVRLYSAESVDKRFVSQEALFDHLFSAMPFPAIPFSDVQGPEDPVVRTFSIDDRWLILSNDKPPYWVVIDPTNTAVATWYLRLSNLFKIFGGAELHPLLPQRIYALEKCYESESRVERISKWDQLLTSDTRDFLLSSNGDKVPISSLKDKLVGLYFCENIPRPPRMQEIKKVYEEAKSRGYDFEIVQITFHYHPFNAIHLDTNPTVRQYCKDISWLSLPFKDPSCRKIQRIFECLDEDEVENPLTEEWVGDSLVLIYPRQAQAETTDSSGVLFQYAGAEILKRWGIEGYPFTRQPLYEAEYEIQKREVTLQSLFPPGECLLRSARDGFDLVDAVFQLLGKRVLVLFAPHIAGHHEDELILFDFFDKFISMLKSECEVQVEDNVAEESKFEVVYVSTDFASVSTKSSLAEFTKDMPWLVRPLSSESGWELMSKVFKANYVSDNGVAVFNEQGELIAKEAFFGKEKEGYELQFPFIDQDLEKHIRTEVEGLCVTVKYGDLFF